MNRYNLTIYTHPHLYKGLIDIPPDKKLNIIVVIPCYNEPDVISVLNSLSQCVPTNCAVEVIVVINSAKNSEKEILQVNHETLDVAGKWIAHNKKEQLKFHILNISDLRKKHAGVGLARKIGMDEAWFRLRQINNEKGIIVSLDADCLCERNYLTSIEDHFSFNPNTPASSIYFEHPTEGALDRKYYDGIIYYELFLRYYNNGLRYAQFPYAYQTLGSCFAVRADVYQKQGGMNQRKAGEDFYFLHKIMPLGNFTEINNTTIILSPRPSNRVPFGTGKSINNYIKNTNAQHLTYHFNTFIDLYNFNKHIIENKSFNIYNLNKLFNILSEPTREFLVLNDYEKNIREIYQNTSSNKSFVKRFFRWFDALKVLKFAHFTRDKYYTPVAIEDAVVQLFNIQNMPVKKEIRKNTKDLLLMLRKIDRHTNYQSKIY